ncbi:hypothetical protein NEOLEDRAFT_1206619 [Neolentinus lepideus HHB14362 ss-1]|uniref:DUF1640-domain-containing protein n=1 Tax=Neolentinus lepideus HHB14362 ss-1 TaxID=1314782 RepID=A0A165RZG5_9AGAM|nr:hypothetical protein NEOLEDRAFT_1206619 [Neolentinus lepideus HHB14362 ss-1]
MYSSIARQIPRRYRSLHTHTDIHLPPSSTSIVPSTVHRDAHTSPQTISDPPQPNQSRLEYPSRAVSLHPHPKDPSNSPLNGGGDGAGPSGSSDVPVSSDLPSSHVSPPIPHASIPQYANPPFHTHRFFQVLEKTFPTPIARGLMRATRALLVDRTGRVKRDGLTTKDLENQAYLFRAALSELRAEINVRHGNETGAIRSNTTNLRRDIDNLDQKMKEDIGTLKHELQMELDNRKTEYKTELKRQDILIEDVLNKSIVTLGDLRTIMEEVKWVIMWRTVVALASVLMLIVLSLEVRPKSPPPPPPAPVETRTPEAEGLEHTDYIT